MTLTQQLSLFLIPFALWAADPVPSVTVQGAPQGAPRIYIDPTTGLQSYIPAAMIKKHVPAVATENKEDARFILNGPPVLVSTESTGSVIARCIFLYCAGASGMQSASVKLVNAKTGEVVWAYSVHKAASGAYQSTAEAIAKHLKSFLESHPQ